MNLGSPINIRLSLETEAIYERAARERGVPLRTYLRQKLEESESVEEELSKLHLAIEQIQSAILRQERGGTGGGGGSRSGNTGDPGLWLEVILLLRQIAQPHRVQLAHAEVRRVGLEVWGVDKNDDR